MFDLVDFLKEMNSRETHKVDRNRLIDFRFRWVYAMFNYYNVAKEINPMRNAVKRAEQVASYRTMNSIIGRRMTG